MKKLEDWIQYIPIKWRNNLNYINFSEYADISVREAEKFFNEIYEDGYLFLKFQIKCPTCNEECSIEEHNARLFKCNKCGNSFEWSNHLEEANYIYTANAELLSIGEEGGKNKSPIDLFREKVKKKNDKIINLNQLNKDKEGVKIFISYAHEDELYKDKLIKHLIGLKRKSIIKDWHDREILAGEHLDDEINQHLLEADIILLMISVDFLNSDYCYEKEMKKALEMHNENIARVIPIIVRKCDWMDSPFSKLNALPTDAKDIKSWDDEDEAYMNIVDGIKKVVNSIRKSIN